jgi:hypothetical protein
MFLIMGRENESIPYPTNSGVAEEAIVSFLIFSQPGSAALGDFRRFRLLELLPVHLSALCSRH